MLRHGACGVVFVFGLIHHGCCATVLENSPSNKADAGTNDKVLVRVETRHEPDLSRLKSSVPGHKYLHAFEVGERLGMPQETVMRLAGTVLMVLKSDPDEPPLAPTLPKPKINIGLDLLFFKQMQEVQSFTKHHLDRYSATVTDTATACGCSLKRRWRCWRLTTRSSPASSRQFVEPAATLLRRSSSRDPDGHVVPLGARGTVIGLQPAPQPSDFLYDVAFDEAFAGGSTLAGPASAHRCYRLRWSAFVNLSTEPPHPEEQGPLTQFRQPVPEARRGNVEPDPAVQRGQPNAGRTFSHSYYPSCGEDVLEEWRTRNSGRGEDAVGERRTRNSGRGEDAVGERRTRNSGRGEDAVGERRTRNSGRGEDAVGERRTRNSGRGEDAVGERRTRNSGRGEDAVGERRTRNSGRGEDAVGERRTRNSGRGEDAVGERRTRNSGRTRSTHHTHAALITHTQHSSH
ncbi:uncharacterized protein LOC108682665 [Hyalella azteca]|uniref:Uncharacterized protein LOC108682665 n=1 Tax=Hyalella azteca TaxID=294128 RepID=A0A979FVB2_HYAAZ|nr:uncharacterized protein LOC108682665 [Hyalella azteca]